MTQSAPETGSAQGSEPREAREAPDVSGLHRQLAAMRQAATIAESNELLLHRKLSPYLDAEIENRDAEIARLEARVAELESGEPGAGIDEEPEGGD